MKNRLTIDGFKSKTLKFLLIAFTVLLVLLVYFLYFSLHKSFEFYNQKSNQHIHKMIKYTIEYHDEHYTNILIRAAETLEIAKHLKQNNKEFIDQELSIKFKQFQEENPHLKTMDVFLSDGTSFLRVHNKALLGDNLLDSRPMIKVLKEKQKPVVGYEVGKYGDLYRMIVPLFYEGEFVGGIEIGILPEYFLKSILKMVDHKGYLFLKESITTLSPVSKDALKINQYISKRSKNSLYKEELEVLKQIPKEFAFQNDIIVKTQDRSYIFYSVRIKNFANETIGYYLIVEDLTDQLEQNQWSILTIVGLFGLFVVLMFLIVRGFILKFGEEVNDFYEVYLYAINGTKDGIWNWNLKTNQVFFNAQWKEMLGYAQDELENSLQTWEQRVHPDDLEKANIDLKNNIEKKTQYYENIHRMKHKNGSWVWILDRGKTFYDKEDNPEKMVGFHTDITKIKNLEEQIIKKDEMMITQSRNAAMGEMISMIAHQWRQPLSVISMGANNILADIELEMINEENLRDISQEIIEQTSELSKTIDDFKEFFKPVKKTERVHVEDIFFKVFKIVEKSLENNNIKVIKEYNSKQAVEVYSRELMQVFINIINNAKEVLSESEIPNKMIKVSIEDVASTVEIKIQDNAGGIPSNIKAKIFDPYFSTKKEKNGTGLGLYMSKIIVEKHLYGSIKAYNEENGAVFKITIPLNIDKNRTGE